MHQKLFDFYCGVGTDHAQRTFNKIILLDDFEGIEKGVINAMHLMSSLQNTHYLAYPPSRDIMSSHGLTDSCTVGMIIPRELVEDSNQ